MSTLEEIKQNFQNDKKRESFNQIPQSHPFRRNQSQMINTQKINPQFKDNQFRYPTPNVQQKFNKLYPKIPDNKTLTQSQSVTNIRGGFNPMNHIPPKYDLYGFLKPLEKRKEDMSILQNQENIKIPWCTQNSNKSGAMTRTELLQLRRKEKIPDISYDLDKDGYVGGRDLVLAKRFDIDKDGKLNEQEKKAAYEGLANNIEDKYLWNIDNQGGRRQFRLLQKRGKFIDAEDFWPIRDTYPVHPISNVVPHCATLSELKKLRKEENIKQINKNLQDYEDKNPSKLLYSSNNQNDENFENNSNANKPLYSSIQQIKDEKLKNARIKCGLEPEFVDNRDIKKHPGLEYVYNPNFKTQKEIKDSYKKESLEESKKLANITHKSDIERLNEREDEIFAKLYLDKEGLTYSKIKDQKRKEINEYNIKTFSSQALGVHGHELPKFAESETNKEFWKLKEGYCENPKFQSQVEYLESIKYYKPPGEELLLNEHRDEDPNWIDPFKRVHVLDAKYKKENLIPKVNNINIFKNFDPNNPKPIEFGQKKQHIYRWTTLVNQFAPNKFKKGRFFDSLPKEGEKHGDQDNIQPPFPAFKGFFSDYMRNNAQKNKSQSIKQKENGNNVENNVLAKDSLFQKYSTRDQTKNILPKNTMVRTKGFQ